ncbi:MAG: MBL fold metallo-hydrolase [Planctomycetes bacterium]|nr:MBL fold metallo-hydrolase [Planctomycetota bacterium]
MATHLTVLASGSSGNCSLLEAGQFGVLLDLGLGPRSIAQRLAGVGANWNRVKAVLLTHTHGDHWNERTLGLMFRQRIPLYCHTEHVKFLRRSAPSAIQLDKEKLLRTYEANTPWELTAGLQCRAFPVSHDSGPTFGFRIEGSGDLFEREWSLGYAADLGTWDMPIGAALEDVDLLALEFNHDVDLQRNSGRPSYLIERCLGEEGHLSNEQGADLLAHALERSTPGRLKHVVQLHLSRQCNDPTLAQRAAQKVLTSLKNKVELHTAAQDRPTARLAVAGEAQAEPRLASA